MQEEESGKYHYPLCNTRTSLATYLCDQKCDQKFPKCSRCERSNAECIGLDSATGRQIPRSYIVHLEDRIAMLESKLLNRGIDPDSSESIPDHVLVKDEVLGASPLLVITPEQEPKSTIMAKVSSATTDSSSKAPQSYLGDSSLGISFAKLMLTAVKFQQTQGKSGGSTLEPIVTSSNAKPATKPVLPALLPPQEQAERYLEVYFAQSNAQLPILHREQVIRRYFEPIYGTLSNSISLASDYTSINRQVLSSDIDQGSTWYYSYRKSIEQGKNEFTLQNTPAKYHVPLFFLNMIFAIASSIHHLEYTVQASEAYRKAALIFVEPAYASPDRLESLQGLLLISTHSLMWPSVPGVWYTLGSVLRACVDLGLHSEKSFGHKSQHDDPFIADMRRRLFWCAYSLDRQVCFYLGRPFGIPEEFIDCRFPSGLDDSLITENNTAVSDYSDKSDTAPSYKVVSITMFKMRKLQAEVQTVLYGNGKLPRRYKNLQEWKADINKKLNNWKISAPKTQRKMNCDFNLIFFNLNYNHTRLILHGLSPKNLDLSVVDYLTVADSSKEVIKCYKTLLEFKRINYTWVAVHNLFMAGTSYLYSLYHCLEVAEQTSLEQIKSLSSDCVTILNKLIDRCDAAVHCRDTFEILYAAVVRLRYDPIIKIPGREEKKITIAEEHQLGKQHLSDLVDNIDKTQPAVKLENPDTPGLPQDSDLGIERQSADELGSNDEFVKNSYDLDQFFKELETMGSFSPSSSTHTNSHVIPEDSLSPDNNNLRLQERFSTDKGTSPKLPSTKEGQKIYNMIYQIPDEPIWEQFFNGQSN